MKEPRIILALLALGLCTSAGAFEIKTRSENPAISDDALRAAVNSVAVEVGQRIPETPDIKVYVYTRALPSRNDGQVVYFHRVQLTKAFTGPAPYPTRAWLPIKSVERYGVDDATVVRAKLDEALREFFRSLKGIDPDAGSPD